MHGRAGARRAPGRARLSRSADFDRVFRQGRAHACREFVLHVFPRQSEEPARLGLSVSRKVGGAVQRNRVKRLLREAFALEAVRLEPGTDAVVVARAEARELAERSGLQGVRDALATLISQAGGRAANPSVEVEDRALHGESSPASAGGGTRGSIGLPVGPGEPE